jgi:hypothetical protein
MDASDLIVTNLQKILQAGAVHIWAWNLCDRARLPHAATE